MSSDVMSRPSAGNSNSDDLSDGATNGDVDLRELIYQSLERDGLISRLKAQLRAAVFTTIEKASPPSSTTNHSDTHLLSYEGINGRLGRAIVLDWLACSHLPYTEDVLKVETSGPQHPPVLSREELVEHLPIKSGFHEGQPILYTLLNHCHHSSTDRGDTSVSSLPENVQESINGFFGTEKTMDLNRLRAHFHGLFSSNFDIAVLNAYLEKTLASSLSKSAYEELCFKWIQACAKSLQPSIQPIQMVPPSNTSSIQSRSVAPTAAPVQRPVSPPSDSSSSSSSSPSSASWNHQAKQHSANNPPRPPLTLSKSLVKKVMDPLPSALIDFGDDDDDDDEEQNEDNEEDEEKAKKENDDEEDTSASILSKRNATPAQLNRLQALEKLAPGDETPRTRTNVDRFSSNQGRNVPVEYDDESFSQSHSIISSVDDITIDRASLSPSANIDYLEDF